jgi:hypothetical protein
MVLLKFHSNFLIFLINEWLFFWSLFQEKFNRHFKA